MHIEALQQRRRGLRLAPLVDVVFLLLVFFMLVARLDMPKTIAVEPPAESGSGALLGSVLIRLGTDSGIDLNGQTIAISDLPSAIAPFLERDPDTRFLVQSASEAPLQDLVQVLDGLRTAGAQNLTLLEPGKHQLTRENTSNHLRQTGPAGVCRREKGATPPGARTSGDIEALFAS